MTEAIKIGDTLWAKPDYGRPGYISREIIGENRASWLTIHGKVSKKTMLENLGTYGHQRWLTDSQKLDQEFIDTHRRAIMRHVEAVHDVALLRQIAELVGYAASQQDSTP